MAEESGWTEERYRKYLEGFRKGRPVAQAATQRDVSRETTKTAPKRSGRKFDAFLALVAAAHLPAPELEYKFSHDRGFKADYAWPDRKLIIERQGGIWARKQSSTRAKQAHTMPLAILRDYEKSNLAQLAGWTYLQFTPEQLDSGSVIETLRIRLSCDAVRGRSG